MISTCQTLTTTATLGLLVAAVPCQAQEITKEQLQQTIVKLREQNKNLRIALVEANKAEKQSTEQLTQVRERLEALGKNLLDGGNDRLVQAAADLDIANERITELENASTKLKIAVQDYVREAVVSDPDSRLRLETAIRELDSSVGLIQKPRPDVRIGNLQQARIISLDQQTGMLVLNIGETQGARIGMTFELRSGQKTYGKAILADVRKAVSGAFVEQLDSKNQSPALGDIAVLITQSN